MRTLIFANGELNTSNNIFKHIDDVDYIIAANGGLRHCIDNNLVPDLIIGDFDSINNSDLGSSSLIDVERITYPVDKDHVDLELALKYALRLGSEDVLILGALGGRLDMTIANILLLAHPDYRQLNPRIMDGNQEIFVVFGDGRIEISGNPGDTVSLIPLKGIARGVTTTGLQYPLDGENLIFGESRGISNTLVQQHTKIQLKKGVLLCSIIHTNTIG